MTGELTRIDEDGGATELFLVTITDADGFPPLSEHKMLRLDGSDGARVAAWGIDGTLCAVSVAARHEGDAPHWALEVATGLGARAAVLERAAVAAGASTVPRDAPHTLWVQREAQRRAAEAVGYEERRRLLRMEGPLPEGPGSVDPTLGTIADGDDGELIALHNRAFAGHPEASGMDQQRLDALRALPWFDPEGVITARIDGRLVGFCWTKLHENGDGEIYFIGVDPDAAGQGLGERLATAGYAHLAGRGARRAMLWVDADNQTAVGLYDRLGMAPVHANIEMAPSERR